MFPYLVLPRRVAADQIDQAGRHSPQQRLRGVACSAASAQKVVRRLLAATCNADACLHSLLGQHLQRVHNAEGREACKHGLLSQHLQRVHNAEGREACRVEAAGSQYDLGQSKGRAGDDALEWDPHQHQEPESGSLRLTVTNKGLDTRKTHRERPAQL